jgi:hypothetical protein
MSYQHRLILSLELWNNNFQRQGFEPEITQTMFLKENFFMRILFLPLTLKTGMLHKK